MKHLGTLSALLALICLPAFAASTVSLNGSEMVTVKTPATGTNPYNQFDVTTQAIANLGGGGSSSPNVSNATGTLPVSNGGTGSVSGPNASTPDIVIGTSGGVVQIGTQELINAQTTNTPYTIQASDIGRTVTHNKSTAVSVTLPPAGTTGFSTGSSFSDINLGVGSVTITPTTSTINGNSSLTLTTGQSAYIISDGTNWVAFLGAGSGGSSGTVNSATQYQLGYYGTTGTAVSGTANILTDSTGDLDLVQTTAATSGTTSVASNQIILGSNAWNSSSASQAANATIQWTAAQGTGTQTQVLKFSMPAVTGFTQGSDQTQVLFSAVNTYIDVVNTNDSAGGWFGESYNVAQFGYKTNSGSAYAYLGLTSGGVVETLNNALGSPSVHSILDDSSGKMAVNASSVTSGSTLTVNGHIFPGGSAPTVSSCGSGAVATGSSDNKGQVTGITSATACTLTFASALPAGPSCHFDNSAGTAVGINSLSTTAVTASMTSLTGTLYYLCF